MGDRIFQHVFGPVPSRRLGLSLGIDPVPLKTCTYDCIYCQLGRTDHRTVERREYVPLENILADLDRKLQTHPPPDYLTLSGSGEPTLYQPLDELIRQIKQRRLAPVAVLTNGSLLWDPEVRESLREADLVIPSLDAGDENLFRYINRPHPLISFEKMVAGLIEFRRYFDKPIWLEVFLLGGVTALDAEVAKIARIAKEIKPDRVQINSVARPPAEEFAYPVSRERLEQLAQAFGEPTEVVADYPAEAEFPASTLATEADILNLLRRRPCSLQDVAAGLNTHPTELAKHLETLVKKKIITAKAKGGSIFYTLSGLENHRPPRRPAVL
jgi:wyosine [tRNA(Phe)-imidazoG37] synthetase (radical SAM superfamily)